jgi:hypothetical protein
MANSCAFGKDWDRLVESVGLFQASKDYIENNGEVRTPSEVIAKLEERGEWAQESTEDFTRPMLSGTEMDMLAEMANTIPGFSTIFNPIRLSEADTNVRKGNSTLDFTLGNLSRRLNIPYQMLDESEAQTILDNSGTPYTGEAGFYVGGVVYFIKGKVNTETAFHEFAHPFVRAIAKENNELFEKLHKDLMATPEGRLLEKLMSNLHPELSPDTELYKEEMLVRALTKASIDKKNKKKPSSGFVKFLKDILYAIKQIFRKDVGKAIEISELTQDTTLDQLADIYTEANINFDIELVNQKDVVAFMRETRRELDSVVNILETDEGAQTIKKSLDNINQVVNDHMKRLRENNNLKGMLDVLETGFETADLEIIRSNINQYNNLINKKFTDLEGETRYVQERAAAFVNTIFQTKAMADKMIQHMQELSKSTTDPSKVKKFYYYQQLTNEWKKTMGQVRIDMANAGILDGPMLDVIGSIETKLQTADTISGRVNLEGSSELLEQVLEPLSKEVDRYYKEIIEELEKKGAPDRILNRYKAEYESAKLDKATLKSWLSGELGDTNVISAWMESFMNIQDPVIFGLASYVNNNMMDVMTTVQQKYNKQSQEIKDLLDSLGYNRNNPKDLFKLISGIDKEGIYGKDGKFVERDRRAFIHHVKGYDIEIARKNDQIKQAELEYKKTGDSTDLDRLYIERETLLKEFHSEFSDEVNAKDDLLSKDDVGKKAYVERFKILNKIQNLNATLESASDRYDPDYQTSLAVYWQEYKQLYSLSYADGTQKKGEDLAIATRLREHREATRKFYEYVPRKGMFQGALKAYEQQILDTNPTIKYGSPEFNKLREEWIYNNSVIAIKSQFFKDRQVILDRINELKAKLPQSVQDQLKLDEILKEMNDQISAYRDDSGQPEGTSMSETKLARLKELQEQFELYKDDLLTVQGVTKDDIAFKKQMDAAILEFTVRGTGENPMDNTENALRYADIINDMNDFGLSEEDAAELTELYQKLFSISDKEATDDYVNVVNALLQPGNDPDDSIDGSYLFDTFNLTSFDKNTIDELLTQEVAETLMGQSSAFKKWFMANHIKTVFVTNRGEEIIKYKRTAAWSITRPVDAKYYETTDILDENGNVVETITRKPKMDFFKRKVKAEYKTERVTMLEALEKGDLTLATVDHNGNWLPKADSKYRNEEYYNLKNRGGNEFKLLNTLLKYHLENQEGLNRNSRLGIYIPRYRKEKEELLVERGGVKSKLSGWASNVKASFSRAPDDMQDGYNPEIDTTFLNLDLFDNEITGIPISGKFDLDIEESSENVLMNMMRYMQSAERHKKLIEISPEVRAIQKVVNGDKGGLGKDTIQDMTKASKSDFIDRNLMRYATRKGTSVRAQTVNAFIEREFEGKTQAGALADWTRLNKTINNLLGLSSMAFFALDIPSALKNSLGARFQSIIHASGGKDISAASLGKGTLWGNITAAEVSFQIYRYGPKSLNVQLYEVFDPDQKFADKEGKFAEGMSRTFSKDVMSGSWLTNTREWTQMNASLGLFGGLMYHQMVDQTINGVTKQIPYIEAWEVRDGQVTVKEGVDKEWDLGGKNFKMMRAKVQGVNRKLNGAYSKFDKTQGERYLLVKLVSFLKRHFVRMFLARWGYRGNFLEPKARWDVGSNEMEVGYYTQSLVAMINGLKSGGKDFKYMTKKEKMAFRKFATELVILLASGMLVKLLFNYDDDDEDRFEKLRQKSGPMPMPFGTESPYEFNFGGYMSNQALFLAKATLNENSAFIPFPGFGLDDYRAMLDFNSIAFGNTLTNYVKILDNLTGALLQDEGAYYKKDVGPYAWQDEGSAKVWNYLGKSFGLSGSQVDPVLRLKNLESIQNRLR